MRKFVRPMAASREELLVEVTLSPLSEAYTYSVPETHQSEIEIGMRVEVPLGRRIAVGFITGVLSERELQETFQVKNIHRIVHPAPCFTPEALEFYKWIAHYYCFAR
jgi:primosomal protein N' (replication factor Y)